MADAAAAYVDRGFRYVKTHIGAPGQEQRDLLRLTAIREAIGPEVGLMIVRLCQACMDEVRGETVEICELR